ncbi:MAG TPA: hypothetical protein PLU72_04210 [Candidatus Ozemobacteraceae bacterium]|nr:hypothetical protein [Candidatus Ozemobacteraceae bacterium]
MKKSLSLALVAIMVLGFCVAATAADDLKGRMEELRAIRAQIWSLVSKPMPTAEDRAQLESLKQEYEAKRWSAAAPVAAQKEPSPAVEGDKAPACATCPSAGMPCRPAGDETKCVCSCGCPCCKDGVCSADKPCCETCCCKAGSPCARMEMRGSCKECPKAEMKKCEKCRNSCKKHGRKHGKKHGKKHGCKKGETRKSECAGSACTPDAGK